MSPLAEIFLHGCAWVFVAFTLLWMVSVKLRDASIIDIFWGLGFVLAAWVYRMEGPPASPRQWLLLALVTIWGLRLSGYIFWRNHGEGEDYRYQAMREKSGDAFWWKSYLRVYLLQATLLLIISTPLLLVQGRPNDSSWVWTDFLGLALWLIGFFFESVGDWQMARFKADPSNQGKVMNKGLWAFTRHPNYFGDAAQWWGYYCFALAVPGGLWTLPSVLLMTLLLLKVSGVALLEKNLVKRRPAYQQYIESTSAFIPWFPGRTNINDQEGSGR